MATPRKTTTAKKPTAGPKPDFQVVEDVFYAQSDEGEIRIPLKMKTKTLRKVTAANQSEVDQLFGLLDELGDSKTTAQLDELDIFDTMRIVTAYFEAFTSRQGATVGEA